MKDDDLGKIIFSFSEFVAKSFLLNIPPMGTSGMLIDWEILDPVGQALRSVHLQRSSKTFQWWSCVIIILPYYIFNVNTSIMVLILLQNEKEVML